MAKELLLEGQKVVPKKLLQNGYEFIFKNLNEVFKSGK
jgi:NAD dependent epimerase/dehydratase family enzyme